MQVNAANRQEVSDLATAMKIARPFLSFMQYRIMSDLVKGEEGAFFTQKFIELANTINSMPRSYDTDGQGDNAVAHLHYFHSGSDWYITERDKDGKGTEQAYGHVILNGDIEMAENGYVCLDEILEVNVEIDLHWTPKTLGEIKRTRYGYGGEPERPVAAGISLADACAALEFGGWVRKHVLDTGSFILARDGLLLSGTHGDGDPYLILSREDGETLPLPSISFAAYRALDGVLHAVQTQVIQAGGMSLDYAEEDSSVINMGAGG